MSRDGTIDLDKLETKLSNRVFFLIKDTLITRAARLFLYREKHLINVRSKFPTIIPDPNIQRIVCAANKNKKTEKIVCGARHFDKLMLHSIIEDPQGSWLDCEQGFVDQYGNFLNREEAYIIAQRQGQLMPHKSHITGTLYSEDLY